MASRRHERRRAREGALALLYSADITEHDVQNIIDSGAYPDEGITVSEYAERLVAGVVEHLDDIDRRLAATSENWALDRMPIVDREILRVAVFEMLYVDEVPVSVAINEAVELAKLYGGEDESSRFVNGILGRISRMGDEVADRTDADSAEVAIEPDASVSADDELAVNEQGERSAS